MLRALPTDMRDRDAAEIEAMFRDGLETAQSRGALASLWFVSAAFWDIARRAPYEHWRRRGRRPHEESTMRSVLADLRFAARSFGRQPGATALIFVTLTLGVAANTAVFAIVDGLFLRPFPFPQPDRLAYVNERAPSWSKGGAACADTSNTTGAATPSGFQTKIDEAPSSVWATRRSGQLRSWCVQVDLFMLSHASGLLVTVAAHR
jgi:hypothetical protein